jgi:HAE1 family hydrophobic/amphiphilic exporter-1
LPDASSLQRTTAVMRQAEEIIMKTPGVMYCTSVDGFSMLSGVHNTYSGFFFISFKPWSLRKAAAEKYQAMMAHINAAFRNIPGAAAMVFPPPAIQGVGTAGGVTFIIEDRVGKDVTFLAENVRKFVAEASKRPELARVLTTLLPAVPQVYVDVDRDKVLKQGVLLQDVYQTLQCFMGGAFVNYFNSFGRQWQVYVEAEGDYRTSTRYLGQFYVRNKDGNSVPLAAVTRVRNIIGPEFTMRYNLYRSAQINATTRPGVSSAQAMRALEDVFAKTMPPELGYDYMGMSFQEQKAQQGVSAMAIFGFSLLCVFLILAAQYESWSLPFSVLLSTPVAVFGAFLGIFIGRYENNVYAQIGLVMLIGLAAKNAILIVEFAKTSYERGMGLKEAALAGARLRLRPILMTAFAFILGCVPLAVASGAGALSRQVMGYTVIGGMLASTCIAIFLIPVSFYVVERISGAQTAARAPTAEPAGESAAPA